MTATTIGKVVGLAAAASIATLSAFKAGRAASVEPAHQIAQSTISAPVATSADIGALREHFDRRFDEVSVRQDGFNGRLSNIEGYMEAQKQLALQKAMTGKEARR